MQYLTSFWAYCDILQPGKILTWIKSLHPVGAVRRSMLCMTAMTPWPGGATTWNSPGPDNLLEMKTSFDVAVGLPDAKGTTTE